jgi:replicative DNA helicase
MSATLAAFPGGAGEANYRLPPHNAEAEQALLGAILVNNDAASRVSDFLLKEHFYEPTHGRIYEAALKLIERGQIANPVTLRHYFENDEALKDVGGAGYLARLAGAAITLYNVEHYGRAVYDLALRRSLIEIGEEMRERAFDAEVDEDAARQIEAAEGRLFKLAESGRAEGGFLPFREALAQAIELADAAFKRDTPLVGLSTSLADLDRKLGGLHNSDLIILAARPAMGKTSLATNIAFHVANAWRAEPGPDGKPKTVDGGVVAMFSLEMSSEQLATRVLGEQAELPSDKIRRGEIRQEEFHRLVAVSSRINEIPLYIDDTPAITISALRTRARRLKRTRGLDLIVVDYLQLLRPSGQGRTENRVQEITEITQGLKAIAKELNVPVLALSQLSRAVESREDKRPQLSDLRESGSIEQDADVVMFLYREEYYHERKEPTPDTEEHRAWMEHGERIAGVAELILGKQRHGPTGTVKLQFQREITKFRNLEASDRLPDGPI